MTELSTYKKRQIKTFEALRERYLKIHPTAQIVFNESKVSVKLEDYSTETLHNLNQFETMTNTLEKRSQEEKDSIIFEGDDYKIKHRRGKITFVFEEEEFKLSVNQFKELVLNKSSDDTPLSILPRVSNEIIIK